MLATYWYYQIWSNRLKYLLGSKRLDFAISFDKDSLYLEFEAGVLWCRFIEQELWFQWLDDLPSRNSKKKNGQVQFKELHGSRIESIHCHPFDRFLEMRFENGHCLGFKGFGRQANVLMFNSGEITSMFRLSSKGDWDFKWPTREAVPSYLPPWEESEWRAFLVQRRTPLSALPAFPWQAVAQGSWSDIAQWLLTMSDASIDGEAQLFWSEQELATLPAETIDFAQWQLPDQTMNRARELLFSQQKNQRLAQLSNRIKQLLAMRSKSQARLVELETRRSYKEIGDLILAHAHHLKAGISSARIPDFYTGEQLRIKLDPALNAAENAKRYYKKAQNQPLEMQERRVQLLRMEESLAQLQQEQNVWELATTFKDVKGVRSEKPSLGRGAAESSPRPFKTLVWREFQIWMGKSAKSNDELLRASSKNDLWFHAKGVSGSHVLVRRTGQEFNQEVIEYAAKLAAENSKARHQGFVPVQMALRKFVVKPKGALPGEVLVQREEVVDVYL